MESLRQVSWRRHGAETANEVTGVNALLALEDADLEMRVLWSFDDFRGDRGRRMPRCILACDRAVDEDGVPTWVGEVGEIVDHYVYDYPLRTSENQCTVASSSHFDDTYQVSVLVALSMCVLASELVNDLQPSNEPYLLYAFSREPVEILL